MQSKVNDCLLFENLKFGDQHMLKNRSAKDRRIFASDQRAMSLLERRAKSERRKLERSKIDLVFSELLFKLALVGIVTSWLLLLSEAIKL